MSFRPIDLERLGRLEYFNTLSSDGSLYLQHDRKA